MSSRCKSRVPPRQSETPSPQGYSLIPLNPFAIYIIMCTYLRKLHIQFDSNHITRSYRKVIEAYYIRRFLPTINDQLDIKSVYLFRNGVT